MAVLLQSGCAQGRCTSCAATLSSPDVATIAEQLLFSYTASHAVLWRSGSTTSGEGISEEGHRKCKEPQSKGGGAGTAGGDSNNGIPDLLCNIFRCHICLDFCDFLLVVFDDLHSDITSQDCVATASLWQN